MVCRLSILFLLLLCLSVKSATYYVRIDGDNANDGLTDSAEGAWLTIQKAAATAIAGDTVNIKAGTYNEFVTNINSGSALNPITFTGERNSGGEWLTVLEPSVQVSNGWAAAPEIGSGVYKQTEIGFATREMTINSKRVASLWTNGWMTTDIWACYATNWTNGADLMGLDTDVPVTLNAALGGATTLFWDGLEALYCSTGSVTYLKLRDGSDPNGLNIRCGRNSDTAAVTAERYYPAIKILNKSYIVWSNLLVRGAVTCVYLDGADSYGVTIVSNYLSGGLDRVYLVEDAHNNTILNNVMTENYYGYTNQGSWEDDSTTEKIRAVTYGMTKYLSGHTTVQDHGIYLNGAGNSNIFVGNIITNGCGNAMSVRSGDYANPVTGMIMSTNVMKNMSSAGLIIMAGQYGTRIYGNHFSDCNANMRYHQLDSVGESNRLVYVYRNTSWLPSGNGAHIFVHATDVAPATYFPTFWTYYNSFSGGASGVQINSYMFGNGGATNLYFLNNIFSDCNYEDASADFEAATNMIRVFDWNLVNPISADPAWYGTHNIKQTDPEWVNSVGMTFVLTNGSQAINAAFDVSGNFTLNGVVYSALPDTATNSGLAWDIGALEYSETPGTVRVKLGGVTLLKGTLKLQ